MNEAVDGLFPGGATEVLVCDGHGPGGINPVILAERARLIRNWPAEARYPFGSAGSFDAVAWVGWHTKAGSAWAHLAHTNSFNVIDTTISGVSVVEFGEFAYWAAELGVRSIFASGNEVLGREAREIVPGIETVAVKRGTVLGRGDELSATNCRRRSTGAVHWAPAAARVKTAEGARRAVERARVEPFGRVAISPPFERVAWQRHAEENPGRPRRANRHPAGAIALLNGRAEPE